SRGEFSCKLAYHLALETSHDLVQNNSDEAIKISNAIWTAKYAAEFCGRVWISKGILSDMLDEQEGLGFGALSGNESGAFL
ncbi:hypothetical protein Tco_1259400, partial [Tanacetum coccineum]